MTSGDALIYRKSVRNEIDEVRKDFGLCQQLDVLSDLFSIEEHQRMTLRIRQGVDKKQQEDDIKDILT